LCEQERGFLKKVIILGLLFIILLVFSGAFLFLKQFPDRELATISASVGNADDCEIGGSSKVMAVGDFIWWYFNLPGISQSYIDEGHSFVAAGFDALICKQGQAGYPENFRRIKRLVLHGQQFGESIDSHGQNRFSLLHRAVISSDISLIKFLIEEGADVSSLTSSDAVWYAKSYANMTSYQLALALRDNEWPVTDEIIELIRKADSP
jgi:hypothetical protein